MIAKRKEKGETPLCQIYKVMIQCAVQGAAAFGVQFRSSNKSAMAGPNGLTWEWVSEADHARSGGDAEAAQSPPDHVPGSPSPGDIAAVTNSQPAGTTIQDMVPPGPSLEDLVDNYDGPPTTWQPSEDVLPQPEAR